jgi:hypothetical protein
MGFKDKGSLTPQQVADVCGNDTPYAKPKRKPRMTEARMTRALLAVKAAGYNAIRIVMPDGTAIEAATDARLQMGNKAPRKEVVLL